VRMDLRCWRRMRPALAPFFTIEGGMWRHKRVDAEVAAWTEKRRSYMERARNGGLAKAAKSTPQAVLKSCSSASSRAEEGRKGPSSRSGRGPRGEGACAAPPRAWPGPKALRSAVVAAMGEDYARSWLDPTGWREQPDPAVVCRLEITAQRLSRDLRGVLAGEGVRVVVEPCP
jgi:hypothetical protein